MSSHRFDRRDYYATLRHYEERLDQANALRRQQPGLFQPIVETFGWSTLMGVRVSRVRSALADSEAIAQRELQTKLNRINLADVWPALGEICHDVALYVGGGAVVGGVIGGGLGALAFGAVPGAAAGTIVGAQAGNLLLGFFGLKSVVGYMIDSLPRAARDYQDGFELAWGRAPDLGPYSLDAPNFGTDWLQGSTCLAASAFARGHEILIIALLAGMVAYLTRGKGGLPALLTEVRQSARLGPKMAGWLEQNADRLAGQPLLQVRGNGTAGGLPGDAAEQVSVPRPRNAKQAARPAEVAGQVLRGSEELLGKTEGGPGTWQLSPKRTGGEAYQEQITGVRRGIEYDVPFAGVKSGKVSFDGYDAARKVLLDAKDWKGYPPTDWDFWHKKVVREAQHQVEAANGTPIEWHFPQRDALDAVKGVFDDKKIQGIKLILTPGN